METNGFATWHCLRLPQVESPLQSWSKNRLVPELVVPDRWFRLLVQPKIFAMLALILITSSPPRIATRPIQPRTVV